MKHLYLDCLYGISGDMLLGLLIDLGLPLERLEAVVARLGLSDRVGVRAEKIIRAGVKGTKVHVEIREEKQPHRQLRHIREMVEPADLPEEAKARALAIYRRLAEAEAKVHDSTPEKIHFHEVGALDAVVDVMGAVVGLAELGIDRVSASPVTVGRGRVECMHGFMPIPAPATAEILRGAPIETGPIEAEMTTPTGAAILREVATRFGPLRNFRVERIGYGAGSRSFPRHTNMLRGFLGIEAEATQPSEIAYMLEQVVFLEAEIDDASPELLGHAMERLFAAGALDVHFSAVQMKKNRPATRLNVVGRPESESQLAETILRETPTLGVRIGESRRAALRREMRKISLQHGEIEAKVAFYGDKPLRAAPEYESCRVYAERHGLPLNRVFAEANARIWEEIERRG